MGGKKQEIRLSICGRLPPLDKIRSFTRGKQIYFVEIEGTAVEREGDGRRCAAKKRAQVGIVVEKLILPQHGGFPGIIVGHGVDAVSIVKDQVDGTDPLRASQCQPGIVREFDGDIRLAVKQFLVFGKALVGFHHRVRGNIPGLSVYAKDWEGQQQCEEKQHKKQHPHASFDHFSFLRFIIHRNTPP